MSGGDICANPACGHPENEHCEAPNAECLHGWGDNKNNGCGCMDFVPPGTAGQLATLRKLALAVCDNASRDKAGLSVSVVRTDLLTALETEAKKP